MITVEHLSNLGQALKDLRWASRKTQAQITTETGMNAPQLSRYENGHEVPSLESLVKYLGALGCDLCDLQKVLTGEMRRAEIGGYFKHGRNYAVIKHPSRQLEPLEEDLAQRAEQKLELTKDEKLSVIEERLREMEEIVAEMRKE